VLETRKQFNGLRSAAQVKAAELHAGYSNCSLSMLYLTKERKKKACSYHVKAVALWKGEVEAFQITSHSVHLENRRHSAV
jgi:hypothetical protein